MGETADVFAPFLLGHPECDYLSKLIIDIESKIALETRIDAISAAIKKDSTLVRDVVGYL